MLTIDSSKPLGAQLAPAAELLRAGAVAVFPTDTVYGIGMAALPQTSPQRIFDIKGRDANKPLPLLIGSLAQLGELSQGLPAYAQALALRHWPGPLTLVVAASPAVPRCLAAPDGSVALRMPNNPVTLRLLSLLGAPLAATSANLQGGAEAASIGELDLSLLKAADLVIDAGRAPIGKASTIVSCLGKEPVILRTGTLDKSQLEVESEASDE